MGAEGRCVKFPVQCHTILRADTSGTHHLPEIALNILHGLYLVLTILWGRNYHYLHCINEEETEAWTGEGTSLKTQSQWSLEGLQLGPRGPLLPDSSHTQGTRPTGPFRKKRR